MPREDGPPAREDAALRLACQALVRAPAEVSSLRLDGPAPLQCEDGGWLTTLIRRASRVAREYNLQSSVSYDLVHGQISVKLARAAGTIFPGSVSSSTAKAIRGGGLAARPDPDPSPAVIMIPSAARVAARRPGALAPGA